MNIKDNLKPASEPDISLYLLVGEAVCAVQHLEDALSHLIVLKKITPPTKQKADQHLEKHRLYTLGRAIKIGVEAGVFSEELQENLNTFLNERNWLIHKSIAKSREEWDLNNSREELFNRIKAIITKAQEIQQMIEKNMMEFAESKGRDMSRVKAETKKYYSE